MEGPRPNPKKQTPSQILLTCRSSSKTRVLLSNSNTISPRNHNKKQPNKQSTIAKHFTQQNTTSNPAALSSQSKLRSTHRLGHSKNSGQKLKPASSKDFSKKTSQKRKHEEDKDAPLAQYFLRFQRDNSSKSRSVHSNSAGHSAYKQPKKKLSTGNNPKTKPKKKSKSRINVVQSHHEEYFPRGSTLQRHKEEASKKKKSIIVSTTSPHYSLSKSKTKNLYQIGTEIEQNGKQIIIKNTLGKLINPPLSKRGGSEGHILMGRDNNNTTTNMCYYSRNNSNSSNYPDNTLCGFVTRNETSVGMIHTISEYTECKLHQSISPSTGHSRCYGEAQNLFKMGEEGHTGVQELQLYQQDRIHSYLHESLATEYEIEPGFLDVQKQITSRMRTQTIDWLYSLSQQIQIHRKTIYLAVLYLDQFLSLRQVEVKELQLFAIGCLVLAFKFQQKAPINLVQAFDSSTQKRQSPQQTCFTTKQIIDCQTLIAKTLQFRFHKTTLVCWVEILAYEWDLFLASGQANNTGILQDHSKLLSYPLRFNAGSNKQLNEPEITSVALIHMVDLALLDCECYQFSQKSIVLSAIYLVMRALVDHFLSESGDDRKPFLKLYNRYRRATDPIFLDKFGFNQLFSEFLGPLDVELTQLIPCNRFLCPSLALENLGRLNTPVERRSRWFRFHSYNPQFLPFLLKS